MKKDRGRRKEEGRRMEEGGGLFGIGHLALALLALAIWQRSCGIVHMALANGHWSFDIGHVALAF